jgi:aspartate oxidase
MLGVQFHPEFLSRPNRPHPLFTEFVNSAKNTLREGGQHSMLLDKNERTRLKRIRGTSKDALAETQKPR